MWRIELSKNDQVTPPAVREGDDDKGEVRRIMKNPEADLLPGIAVF